ncbi:MAG: hypothetical protein EBZ77_16505, partial [Chitinophagia bacterium]|nr:hypothetical protein [Chitinophagia bacterium]
LFANVISGSVLAWYWVGAFFGFVLGFMLALMHARPEKAVYQSLINIPKFMFLQVLSLLRSRRANKISVATTHFHSQSIDEIKSKP